MKNKRERLARFGILIKGVVYALIGLLSALAAFNLGGEKSGSKNVLYFIAEQPFGKILLVVIAAGLIGYAFWRIYQAIIDHEKEGDSTSGFVKRAGYFISGLFYGVLAYSAVQIILNIQNESSNSTYSLNEVLQKSYGPYLVGLIAFLLLGKAAYQFYQGYTQKFLDKLDTSALSEKQKGFIKKSGLIGFFSRGIVIMLIAYSLFKMVFNFGASSAGKAEAFEMLQNEFGSLIMGVVAIGLLGYAFFMFVQAKYRWIKI